MLAAPPQPRLERLAARFEKRAFAPHRHDSYGLGFTLQGVQSFRYRGAGQQSLPGQVFVLHPDELHDGRAGSDAGYSYKILYLEPRVVRQVLGTPSLPFVREAVSHNRRLLQALSVALDDLERPLEELQADAIVAELAEALGAADPSVRHRPLSAPHVKAVETASAFLDAHLETNVSAVQLEAVTGLDRYCLARHFRRCLGTSPHRYLTQRRLDRARDLLARGTPLAAAAAASGFADQSHLTRQFKKAYGLTPGRWTALMLGDTRKSQPPPRDVRGREAVRPPR